MVYLLAGILILSIVIVIGIMPLFAVNLNDELLNADEGDA